MAAVSATRGILFLAQSRFAPHFCRFSLNRCFGAERFQHIVHQTHNLTRGLFHFQHVICEPVRTFGNFETPGAPGDTIKLLQVCRKSDLYAGPR